MPASFDNTLAEATVFPAARSIKRFMLFAIGLLTVFWAAIMAVVTPSILRRLPSLISAPAVGGLVVALYGGIITWGIVDVLFLYVLIKEQFGHGGRGPVRVVVGIKGIHFFWREGKSRLEPWGGTRFPITIRDFSGAGYQAQIKVARYTSFALTGDAARGVITEARRLGLQISESPISGSAGTRGTLITIPRLRTPLALGNAETSDAERR